MTFAPILKDMDEQHGYYALTPEEARQEREAGRKEGLAEGLVGLAEGRQEILAMLSETQREKIMQRLASEKR